jgi:hypothetical protein
MTVSVGANPEFNFYPPGVILKVFQNVKNKNDKTEESPRVLGNRIHEEIPQKCHVYFSR